MVVTPAMLRDGSGTKIAETSMEAVSCEEGARDRQPHEVVVEHVGGASRLPNANAAALSSNAASPCHSLARLAASETSSEAEPHRRSARQPPGRRRRQPLVQSQALPDVCHFAAEFAEYCADIAPTVPSLL